MRRQAAAQAQNLRKRMTEAETKLWLRLRNRRLEGAKFRRQFPFGRYVLDFVCLERKLVIEIDGGQHSESQKDLARTKNLERDGFRVLRFWNNDVLGNIEGVLETIGMALSKPPPSPCPSPRRGEGTLCPQQATPSPQRGEGRDEGATQSKEPSN